MSGPGQEPSPLPHPVAPRSAIDRVVAVDVHAEGEPGRVITHGGPVPQGDTMLAKARWLETHADHFRLRMLREPAGYPGLCANLIVEPTDPEADAGFIVMEQTEYPPMSGSNTICVATVLLETGLVAMDEPITELTLEAPAGLIRVRAECIDGKVTKVWLRNVPAFAIALDRRIEVPELGPVTVDIAWGGMFFVIADADVLGVSLDASNGAEIARVSEMIRVATVAQHPVTHPLEPSLSGPTISQLSAAPSQPEADLRTAVTVSTGLLDWDRPDTWTGALDRCPCGTGTTAKMAVLAARGELDVGGEFVHEGPLGTTFTGRFLERTQVGGFDAVSVEIGGQAWVTGVGEYLLDRSDPFPAGFTIGDIWP